MEIHHDYMAMNILRRRGEGGSLFSLIHDSSPGYEFSNKDLMQQISVTLGHARHNSACYRPCEEYLALFSPQQYPCVLVACIATLQSFSLTYLSLPLPTTAVQPSYRNFLFIFYRRGQTQTLVHAQGGGHYVLLARGLFTFFQASCSSDVCANRRRESGRWWRWWPASRAAVRCGSGGGGCSRARANTPSPPHNCPGERSPCITNLPMPLPSAVSAILEVARAAISQPVENDQ